ncbi:hypothetical protein F2Q69_00040710 [Brassica cretica]|uniref:Uncharacterized protein n=1 Tax=Brassica cretica TaxID=69181 RepID=A0A8S9NAU6_BRACR|nr:hypothetical protein F2Q69_00040710 [Brassica cretica]
MLRNTGVRESNSQARMDRDSFELSPRRTKVNWSTLLGVVCSHQSVYPKTEELLEKRDISAGESSEETTGEGEQREKENCQDGYWEQNTEKETGEKWIGADRKRWLEGRSESVMAGASLSALLQGVLVHFMTSSSLEIQGCGSGSGTLSMAGVLSVLDGWLETKPSLVVYLDHVGMVG